MIYYTLQCIVPGGGKESVPELNILSSLAVQLIGKDYLDGILGQDQMDSSLCGHYPEGYYQLFLW